MRLVGGQRGRQACGFSHHPASPDAHAACGPRRAPGQTGATRQLRPMVKRLEQVAALVVAAGLAIVSYWLFFSWMGQDRRPKRSALEATPGLDQPLLGFGVVDAGQVGLHLVAAHGQAPAVAQGADAAEGA